MKYFSRFAFPLLLLILISCHKKLPLASEVKQVSADKILPAYESIEGDHLNARIYTLDNGLKVYLSANPEKPRVQTFISVNAGYKNDPADATGLAHYLEHMLFKGTDKMGTIDYEKEKPLIDEIKSLFETYRVTTDSTDRKKIYHKIDSLSYEAAKYAAPNEYDNIMTSLGAKGTNAYTSFESTTYVNDIPSNQIDSWLTVEAERFRNPVLRLFHTELEAVYEEKNIGLGKDGRTAWEAMLSTLFKKHPFGTQTSIGTIEHLKNPSMVEIEKFYNKYYVPNNMAIVIVGDIDFDATISSVQKHFSKFKSKPVEQFKFEKEELFKEPVSVEIVGPEAESTNIAYRFDFAPGSKELLMLKLTDMILNNSSAGLIDLNLNQKQLVRQAGCSPIVTRDYVFHYLYGMPTQNQKLEDVVSLIEQQIELIKKGEFPDWMLEAVIKDFKLHQIKETQSNRARAQALLEVFNLKMEYYDAIREIDRMQKITKTDIIDFVSKYYTEAYRVTIYKRNGEKPNSITVTKPQITPLDIRKEQVSEFAEKVKSRQPKKIQPVFVDFKKELTVDQLNEGVELLYKQNTNNELFSLNYIFDYGSKEDPMIGHAVSYANYLGSSKLNPTELQEEFYKIGCSYSINSSDHSTSISISGLNESFTKAVQMVEELIANIQPDEIALQNLKAKIYKAREDAKKSKGTIHQGALLKYVVYQDESPYLKALSNDDIEGLTSQQLISEFKKLFSHKHTVTYFGPMDFSEAKTSIAQLHNTNSSLIDPPARAVFNGLKYDQPKIYVADYDMPQVEVFFYKRGETFNKENSAKLKVLNEYLGGGMSSITFQEIREARALAYSTYAFTPEPIYEDGKYYFIGYIGTQGDKMKEAIGAIDTLMMTVPYIEKSWLTSKESIAKEIETGRIINGSVISAYRSLKQKGYDYDRRKEIYEALDAVTFEEVKEFHLSIYNQPNALAIIGKVSEMDMEYLKTLGEVEVVTLEQIFGY